MLGLLVTTDGLVVIPYDTACRRRISYSQAVRAGDYFIFKLKIMLVEDRNGEVGYAPAGFLVVILDTTAEEQESDATKKGQENSTEENRIGQEGERRKSYSAAVIDGIKRNTTIYVGDSIIRKTDSRLY